LESSFQTDKIHVDLKMVRIALKTRSDLFVVSETVQKIVILRLGQPIRPEDQVLEIISHLVVYKFLEMMIGAVVRPENKLQEAKKGQATYIILKRHCV
jgi:hypothetical protein